MTSQEETPQEETPQEERHVQLSPSDRDLYQRMLECLNAIADSATHGFLTQKAKRSEIMIQVCMFAREMSLAHGCGNLCTDKNHGCVPCDKDEGGIS